MKGTIFLGFIPLMGLLISGKAFSQNQSLYLFHPEGVTSPQPYQESKKRPCKTSIDAGLVYGFATTTGVYTNYINGLSSELGYTFGLIEEIPIQKTCYIDIGAEILGDGISFDSYFFAPGSSLIYNGDETYSHHVSMNEIQVPILYKFPLGSTDRKLRSIYMTLGVKFRYISYTNSTVTNDSTGYLVWEGQKDVTTLYKLFSPFGSSIFEISLGYQRNTRKKKKRGWYMNLEYNYGLSPLVYAGNRDGSNYLIFHLNTLIFKIGKIF